MTTHVRSKLYLTTWWCKTAYPDWGQYDTEALCWHLFGDS